MATCECCCQHPLQLPCRSIICCFYLLPLPAVCTLGRTYLVLTPPQVLGYDIDAFKHHIFILPAGTACKDFGVGDLVGAHGCALETNAVVGDISDNFKSQSAHRHELPWLAIVSCSRPCA